MQGSETTPFMLVGGDRVYYYGHVGNAMQVRCLCPMTLYAAPTDAIEISIDAGPWQAGSLFAVAPFTRHRVQSSSGFISTICIETETVERAELAQLMARVNAPESAPALWQAIHEAHQRLVRKPDIDGFTSAEFDAFFLGRALGRRPLDPRIARVVKHMGSAADDAMPTADECAASTHLSASRFLHLFKECTDMSFRSYRSWRRARRFLDRVNARDSLTGVALDLGYPDASHFSNSIRQIFGLQPRYIRDGSRHLKVHFGSSLERPERTAE